MEADNPGPQVQSIEVCLGDSAYPIYLGAGIIDHPSVWNHHLGQGKSLVISNETVAPIYLEQLLLALGDRDVTVHIIPDGEQYKTLETWSGIIDCLVGMQARRDASVIALGGGVVGDISGFAAASYMRGIRFVQIPTTLLAQVDASVGGKTGINHTEGKNLIGAFHQPDVVCIDTNTLNSLQDREFRAGMAEVIKYGAIMDEAFFSWLESSAAMIKARDGETLHYMIQQCVRNKAKIVAQDERESGIRAILNFGHSFGHALETTTSYQRYLHGEAVAIGMVIAARLSEQRKLSPTGTTDRLVSLLKLFDLPVSLPSDITLKAMTNALELDKKAVADGLRLILLSPLGNAQIDDQSTHEEIVTAMGS
jgi:3-dehydroquinate synthase